MDYCGDEASMTIGLEPEQVDVCRLLKKCPTPLIKAFFSRHNVQVIQDILRHQIWLKMQYRIGNQSEKVLRDVMLTVYEWNSTDPPSHVQAQVNTLNEMVVAKCLPEVASSIKAYIAYMKDASSLPTQLPLPINNSIKGTKTLSTYSTY